jgi:hypothetical protein
MSKSDHEFLGSNPNPESFAQCPEIFLSHLPPEQYRATQQIYQTAYEKAIEKQRAPKPFKPPFQFEFKDGI